MKITERILERIQMEFNLWKEYANQTHDLKAKSWMMDKANSYYACIKIIQEETEREGE